MSALKFIAVAVLGVATVSAQSVISARPGVIHYTEGDVLLDNKLVQPKFGLFPDIKQDKVLRTELGRAEVLLTPGVFLRIGENTAVRMLANKLDDTRMELLSGTVLLECAEILEGNSISLVHNGKTIAFRKKGLYRLNSDPPELRTYDGEAEVLSGRLPLRVRAGRLANLDGEPVTTRFDTKAGDPLHRWSARRANYTAMANLSAAKSIRDTGYDWQLSGWRWNPYFGLFTYIPGRGVYYSPFGCSYWSPGRVYAVYYQPPVQMASGFGSGRGGYNPELGYSTVSGRSAGGLSGGGYSGASGGAGVSASGGDGGGAASSPRTSESSSPRESGGGRGR